jgi:uncharacterized protein YjbI with pentapeptide repeats
MANADHLEIVKQGTAALDQWRAENRGLRLDLRKAELRLRILRQAHLAGADLQLADLRGCDLRLANLRGADLRGANLRGANLAGTDLSSANLGEANLSETILTRAQLGSAYLIRADLRGAQLVAADLYHANLSHADLRGADLRGAVVEGVEFSQASVGWTAFGDLDLSTTKSLDTLQHDGPSTVGVDTLYKSRGKIAPAFLCGCGVPDRLVEQANAMGLRDPDVFVTIFVSGSEPDEKFCRTLCTRLRELRMRAWPVLEHGSAGLGRGPASADKLIVVFSESNLGQEWLNREICETRRRERELDRRVLFPVRLVAPDRLRAWTCADPETGEDVAAKLHALYIPDFTNWQNEGSFQPALRRLLSDLAIDED